MSAVRQSAAAAPRPDRHAGHVPQVQLDVHRRPARTAATAPASAGDSYEPEIPLKRASIVPEEETLRRAIRLRGADSSRAAQPAGSHVDDFGGDDRAGDLSTLAQGALRGRLEHGDERVGSRKRARATGCRRARLSGPGQTAGPAARRGRAEAPRWTFFLGRLCVSLAGHESYRAGSSISLGLILAGLLWWRSIWDCAAEFDDCAMMGIPLACSLVAMAVATLLAFSFAALFSGGRLRIRPMASTRCKNRLCPSWISGSSRSSAWPASGFFRGAIGFPLTLDRGDRAAGGVPCRCVLLFPILLLSALECDSFLAAVSRRRSGEPAGRAWRAWLVFYLVTHVAVGGLGVIGIGLTIAPAPYLTVLVMARRRPR